jgi:hypothetical protein
MFICCQPSLSFEQLQQTTAKQLQQSNLQLTLQLATCHVAYPDHLGQGFNSPQPDRSGKDLVDAIMVDVVVG